jgi:pyruvate formate lyase activating enzyme
MIQIGGLQKLTLIDFPGRIAATVFVIGCNFKCPWCYSSELVLTEKIKKQPKILEKEFLEFLKERKKLLEGLVLCGGEPSINKKLPVLIKKIKKLGYLVKLDTNGSNPKMLKKLIKTKLIDYVAMDMKLPKERYPEIFGKRVKIEDIEESIKILKEGKVDYEFRTTVVPTVLNKEDILKIAKWIRGAKRYYLQNFRPEKTIDPEFEKIKPYPQEYLLEIQKAISPFFEVCQVR